MAAPAEPRTKPKPRVNAGTQAVDRAAHMLVHVIEAGEPQLFTKLHEALDLPKSTTSRLLSALERHGLLQRDQDGAFRPGPVLARYASLGGSADLAAAAQPYLERISEKTGETVNLAVPSGGAAEQIAQVDSKYVVGAMNWVGLGVPMHCSAPGKIFLAYGAAERPDGPLERLTPNTITSHSRLNTELRDTRRRGYAISMEELEPGLISVAAAVRGHGRTVIAGLAVSGPSVRLTPKRVTEVGELLNREATGLSDTLGGRR